MTELRHPPGLFVYSPGLGALLHPDKHIREPVKASGLLWHLIISEGFRVPFCIFISTFLEKYVYIG